ncbi:MAG: calcineurin-like phosphoesterase C-terminal domain-containing protein [Gemmatimonadetes bacterium]|nr:calcineurin-like phosphoesterase C-terminal domain-containing protein [Gemmatimonadota bacterium]
MPRSQPTDRQRPTPLGLTLAGDSLLSRRSFLRVGAVGASAFFLPDPLMARPGGRIPELLPGRPIRIRGRVRSDGNGVGGVAVSDGLDVVVTDRDGRFELISDHRRDYLRITVPSGQRIPQSDTGTARFFRPIAADGRGEMEAVFDLEPLREPDDDHVALLLADIQVQNEQEVAWFLERPVPDVRDTLRSLGDPHAVGIACGDIMYDHLEHYPGYLQGVSRMGIPFFQVLGNHDEDQDSPTDEGSTATFSSYFGPPYYSFDRGAVHYVVLDDVFWYGTGYLGYMSADQLTWLENDLRHVEPGRPVIAIAHIPILGSRHLRIGGRDPNPNISVTNREELYRLLEPFQAHIVTGHTHENEHVFEGGVHEHVVGAVCGTWWSGPICGDGTPMGYSVYEMSGEEVTWRYKSTGHDFDHQIRAYGHGAEPTAPDEIVANVWDWDPEWRVLWYEDGERKGEMARRTGYDPLSVELHAGDELPPRREWADPIPTGHLFYAPASRDARVRVEATDRFGRVYSAEVRR